MKKAFKWSVVSLVIICELCFLLSQGVWLHGPVFDVSYRHQQRVAAFWDNYLHPSPVAKATLDMELSRMDRYLAWKTILIVGVFVGMDWFGFYYFRNYGHKKTLA